MSLLVPMLLPPRNMPWYHPRTHFQYTIHVSNVTTWRHRFNHLRKIIDTWAPVSQRASVSNPAHFWQYIYAPQNELPGHAPVVTNGLQRHLSSLCLLCIFALPKRIWPGKVSYVVSSVSVDISLNNSWQLQNHYTAWKRRYLFASTEPSDMVGQVRSNYTLSRWCSLLPFPDTLLHPRAKWSVEPHLKQWSQLSTPAALHELHWHHWNCDWLPDT